LLISSVASAKLFQGWQIFCISQATIWFGTPRLEAQNVKIC